jgi:2-polyprenyl-6-methoxyphenol hydroxylase-like FAD-dependent oxidoreductase
VSTDKSVCALGSAINEEHEIFPVVPFFMVYVSCVILATHFFGGSSVSTQFGKRAVVVGAGIAGLAAARVLADYFESVVILENDVLPCDPAFRPGTPQSKHAHALLGGGQKALASLFPGFEQDLTQAGAVPIRVASDMRMERPNYDIPQRDLGMSIYSMSRPLIECVVRKSVAALANVEFRERCRAQGLVLSPNKNHGAVTAVHWEHGDGQREQIESDFVVDASGHGALTLAALASLGQHAPDETTIGVDIGYATALFDIPAEAPSEWKILITFPDSPRNRRGAFILPAEGNHWLVTLSGRYEEKPPDDWDGYLAHAKQTRTPTAYNAVRSAKRVSEIARFGFKGSRWRHFERLPTFPDGLLPVGDSICRFNPLYGQGMTVAAQEACLLQRLLAARAAEGIGIDALALPFFQEAQAILQTPWEFAAVPDFIDPLTEGQRPPDISNTLRYSAAMFQLAVDDPAVHKVIIEVQQLLKPQSAYRDPALVERVDAVMAAQQAAASR